MEMSTSSHAPIILAEEGVKWLEVIYRVKPLCVICSRRTSVLLRTPYAANFARLFDYILTQPRQDFVSQIQPNLTTSEALATNARSSGQSQSAFKLDTINHFQPGAIAPETFDTLFSVRVPPGHEMRSTSPHFLTECTLTTEYLST